MLRLLPLVNLLALMRLFPVLRRVPCDFDDRRKAGVSRPVFDPGKFPNLNLDLTAWTKTDR